MFLALNGWNVRKVANSLHVGVSCIERLHKKHFPNVKLLIRGKPQKLIEKMEISCIKNLTKGRISVAREAVKQLQEEFKMEVSDKTICHGLSRQCLYAKVK